MNFDNPLVRIGGYVVFGLVVFVAALLITFPDGQVKQIAAVQIESQLERNFKKNFEVEVGDLDFWWLLGIELENLSIKERRPEDSPGSGQAGAPAGGENPAEKARKAKAKAKEKEDTSLPLELRIPSIAARLAPLTSALNGGLAAKFHLGLGGGSISGTYVRAGQSQRITASINEVNLRETDVLTRLTGIPFFGTMAGEADLSFALNRPVLTDGNVQLKADKLTIGPKKEVKIESLPLGYIKIPRTNLGNLRAKMHVEDGKGGQPTLKIDRFDSQGQDLQTQIWGHVKLGSSLARADSRMRMRLKFNPAFIRENELTPILRLKEFQNGKKGNWHGFVLWGPLGKPNFKGAAKAADGPSEDDKAKPQGGGESGK